MDRIDSEKIARLRRARDLTQTELGNIVGTTRLTIGKIEKTGYAQISVSLLAEIARALRVNVADLLIE